MPSLHTVNVREALRQFDFRRMFIEELGWDHLRIAPLPITEGGATYLLQPIAEKRGVQVFNCAPGADGRMPTYATRQKIERTLTALAHEHLIVFADPDAGSQVWQWVKREQGSPAAYREHSYHIDQSGDGLLQKLERISFPISAEESLTITGVTQGLRDAFDKDRVTRRFYDRFKKEHTAFLDFITGIREQGDREWYASLMLNRLMFVYFIQKKGFLNGDTDYLRKRVEATRRKQGNGDFLSFYRYFLLRLFHEGLGSPEHSAELERLLGRVPYLNGGLFDMHALEEANSEIEIPDDAFERLFDFFDEYQWHLDDRPLRNDKEINPDVLGYIFEKYINQKQMGAYYTKEDITEYISKSTIIPYLFDAAEKKCAVAFQPDGALWRLLREDPDRYIYEAVRHGVDLPLPAEVEAGIDDVSKRGGWNRPAAEGFALPTETWREHVARRQRCLGLRTRLATGEIASINQVITENLNIRQLAQDAIERCEGPELLRAFWQTLVGRIPDRSSETFPAWDERVGPDLRLWSVPVCGAEHPPTTVRSVPGADARVRGGAF